MNLRLDEYYYIINIDYGWDEIEEYMPKYLADKYIEFKNSHDVDETADYLHSLYFYINVIDLYYDINDIDLEKSYINYKAIIKIKDKYYSFDWYYTWYWNFDERVDANQDLTEVFPKEVKEIKYENK